MAGDVPRTYRTIIRALQLLVRCFFRRVIVTGLEHIPERGGGILVSWHPNGLIDPGLLLTKFPRQVVFGARHGIFKWPLLGTLMRKIGTVPIYRAQDLPDLSKEERKKANQKSLEALAGEIARGSFSALFPEGVSHDAPHLKELKTGAARLYFQARALQDDEDTPAVIIPVGLHYDEKQLFRSNALVEFYPPIEVEQDGDPKALTAEIERVLHDVVLATESWELHKLMHRARRLMRAERAHRAGKRPGKSSIDERVLGFARVRNAYEALKQTHPEQVEALQRRVAEYNADLTALGLNDHELDKAPRLVSPWLYILLGLQVLAVFFFLPPVLVIGWVVNAPAAMLLIVVSWLASKKTQRHSHGEDPRRRGAVSSDMGRRRSLRELEP